MKGVQMNLQVKLRPPRKVFSLVRIFYCYKYAVFFSTLCYEFCNCWILFELKGDS